MKVYVVYESNFGELILDGCEPTQLIGIFDTKEKACQCKLEQIDEGTSIGYVIDEENTNYEESDLIIMFKNEQENWNCCYEIHVEEMEIQ